MYLKHITIAGFKSFAAETTLSFIVPQKDTLGRQGMTAIVGPNGSGKSNVSDAIRWVMGEQSMKNLRGKKSEDVIFAGSETKNKQSMARVALTFDNTDKKLPVEYDEVVIERKMFRSGESEFLINGARVRLMDVVDTLAEAGLGRGSHCVVGQGMTDAILGATPIERRHMIEDAAGVKHFQIKKTRSEKKLERTRDNIQRTRELIAEVEPHLKMLKRQAQKAAKGKEVYDELKNLQRTYFAFMWQQFEKERAAAQEQKETHGMLLKNIERDVDGLNEQIATEAKKVENANVIGTYEVEKKEVYALLRTIDQKIATAQGRVEVEKERKIQEQKVKSIPVDLGYVRERLQIIRSSHEKLVARIASVESLDELDALKDQLTRMGVDLDALHEDAGKKSVALPADDNSQKILKIDEAIALLHEEVISGEKERTQAQEKIVVLDDKIKQEMSQDQKAREQFFVIEKMIREKQGELDRVREKYNDVKIILARLEVREEDVSNEARQELGVEIEDLPFDGEHIDVQQTELHINKLHIEYERIGGIDPMVVEEYEETQERFDFLSKEADDLDAAVTKLREVIKEMDKKIHEAFVKAYKEINIEFTRYFRILFGGGNAKLAKIVIDMSPRKTRNDDDEEQTNDEDGVEVDDDDEVKSGPHKTEVGIEIIASPPGKKVKHLSLLSGGERSLASIAMLFAIISYNPPPFTVLDEVEAALDEANSRRLAKIFSELSNHTQFIIITHNRETMRHADMLYGVTMANDGASQILSVKLDQLDEHIDEQGGVAA